MATPKTADSGAPEKATETATTRTDGQPKWVKVYDTNSGNKLPNPVPAHFLDGRFPHLKEVPSTKKAGK